MLFDIFVKLLDMSIASIVVIAVVLLARGILHKAPKKYSYMLWVIVAIRLLCPVSVSSPISIYNIFNLESNSVLQNISEQKTDITINNSLKSFIDRRKNIENEGQNISQNEKQSVGEKVIIKQNTDVNLADGNVKINDSKTMKNSAASVSIVKPKWIKIGTNVWLVGVMLIIFWNIYLLARIKNITKYGVKLRENIYECDGIPTPFVLGVLPGKIFIPFRLKETEQEYIICHEKYHITRKDNIIQIASFLLCVVYWFNPFVWFSYFLMIRDMEMSCDEYVLAHMNSDIRAEYSKSLLSFATNSRSYGVGMLAFGESSTKSRVKHVMKFKRAGKWIGIIAILVFIIVGVSCLTDASKSEKTNANKNLKPGKSTELALKNNDFSEDSYKILSTSQIGSYELAIVYYGDNKINKKPDSGYFESAYLKKQENKDIFGLFCSKNGKLTDNIDLTADMFGAEKIAFPVEGFPLIIADYDGDGDKNDFALGQGQNAFVLTGNWMSYRFFGVDDDGSIVSYYTSSENRETITTTPGEYSPEFVRKNGQLFYRGLGEDGVEEMTTTICRKIIYNVADDSQKPNIIDLINRSMPQMIVDELKKKGVVTIIYDETDQTVTYSAGNDYFDPDLRLDYTYNQEGILLDYVNKEYGFTEQMKDENDKDYLDLFIQYFLGESQENLSLKKVKNTGRYDDSSFYTCYEDKNQNSYIIDVKTGMVISFERGNEKRNISVKQANIDIMQTQGADGTSIYYASENRMIFGGYYGLFVYDLEHHQFEQSLDLASIGYDNTQGDDASEYMVSKDGNTVYFHHIAGDNSDEMLVYDISNNTLTRENYSLNRDDLYYGEYLTDGQDADDDYDYTYASFLTSDGKKASVVLQSTFTTIGELGYTIETDCDLKDQYKNYLVYPLFPKDEYADLEYFSSKDIKDLDKIEISFLGKHYECTDTDVLKKIEEACKNPKKIDGASACSFESVMYITTKDGKKGMVVPATDDCNIWIMNDGSFEVGKYWAFHSLIEAGCIKEKITRNSENNTTWSFSANNCQREYSFGEIRFSLPGKITEKQKESLKKWPLEDKLFDQYEYTEVYSGDNQLAYLRVSSEKKSVLAGFEKVGESKDHVGYNEDGVMSGAEYQDESGKKYFGWLGKERGVWFFSLYPAESSLTDGMAITKLIMESVK